MTRGHHLPFLEWMITTTCDLACPGCDRFIDYDHNWTQDYNDLESSMKEWSTKLDPDHLTIIGGEPLIHPRIYDILKTSRRYFDHSVLEIYTNGFLLEKRQDIVDVMLDLQPAKISLTIHNQDPGVRKKIENLADTYIFDKLPWTQTDSLTFRYENLYFEITNPTTLGGWYDYRKIVNGKVKPFEDNKKGDSYYNCTANIYPIIYKNELYKCPPISMLKTHLTKYDQLDDNDWQDYLAYKPITLSSPSIELEEFINNIHYPHDICRMCPANPEFKNQEEAIVKSKL